ncbi:MAG: HypC/HybG/HupF family hydrogenase formation chaperone [Candidatus Eisenbacteria bacterium]|uniref:HypC/HybG/HupF family hydrogenase formation chaperone n=1 Tax=Eiseniibacteriota bacterium TaxID=2212470 RepID=A0A948RT22_UNCEI|nr:HypC/HybG/HupF family hydrogenase formation chaperone [Candidatus Eisenbacteria bacterium]MBU1948730.1 HypC/HybG/HupF family hydrogenase formation chaperone [Candidatus Eisenbacteria bacterium]MBU2690485.1 HypC/HybG/HupF family hydrogenase formation chaperone [Candidatus Eisenbacteria bacterium]
MCLAVPMKLIEKKAQSGIVELKGIRRQVSLMLVPEAQLGEHLLIHAGYAIGSVDENEAAETIRILEEMAELDAKASREEIVGDKARENGSLNDER